MLFIVSLCLGVLAGLAFAYLSLQYSIDLQKLVGLRGRYTTVSVELQQMKKKAMKGEEAQLVTSPPPEYDATHFEDAPASSTYQPETAMTEIRKTYSKEMFSDQPP